MSHESSSADDGKASEEYEISPVDPEVNMENPPYQPNGEHLEEVCDQDAEPLSVDEQAAWTDAVDSLDQSIYPALEEFNSLNSELVNSVGLLYKVPRSKEQRVHAEDQIENIRTDILGNLQEILTDMYDSRISDEYFIEYASSLICEHTIDRIKLLNEEFDDETSKYFKYPNTNKISRWVSDGVECADNANNMISNLVEVYDNQLEKNITRIRKQLKDVYRDHDIDRMGENLAIIVNLLERIENDTNPERRRYPY